MKIVIENYGKNLRWLYFSGGILLIMIGLNAVFDPILTTSLLSIIIGACLLYLGVTLLLQTFSQVQTPFFWSAKIFIAILSLIFGGVFIFSESAPYQFFSGVLGVWSVISGLMKINFYINVSKMGGYASKNLLLKGLTRILFGACALFSPVLTETIFMQIMGFYSVILGLDLILSNLKEKN